MLQTNTYEWSVSKTSSDESISVQNGTSGTAVYTVMFTQTGDNIPTYTVSSVMAGSSMQGPFRLVTGPMIQDTAQILK